MKKTITITSIRGAWAATWAVALTLVSPASASDYQTRVAATMPVG